MQYASVDLGSHSKGVQEICIRMPACKTTVPTLFKLKIEDIAGFNHSEKRACLQSSANGICRHPNVSRVTTGYPNMSVS
jgi:hypothetical protein